MTVIVPAFLVGMALMALIRPVPSNVRAIEMSPFASEAGENFDVLVGGGAAFKGSLTSRRDMAMLYDELSSGLNARSEGLGIFHLPKAKSSQIMSDRLLESYYYHGDTTRAGAFVLHDEITLAVSIDWPFYKKFLRHLVNVTLNRIELLKDIIIPKEDFESAFKNLTGLTFDPDPSFNIVSTVDALLKDVAKALILLPFHAVGSSRFCRPCCENYCRQIFRYISPSW